jgi:hypothetical protein
MGAAVVVFTALFGAIDITVLSLASGVIPAAAWLEIGLDVFLEGRETVFGGFAGLALSAGLDLEKLKNLRNLLRFFVGVTVLPLSVG